MESSSLTQRITGLSPAKRALLEAKLKENGRPSAEHAITRRAERNSAPLSFAQQRLWFLHQLEPDNPSYNQPKAIRLGGLLDVTSLQKALDHLVARHEVLRTTFASGEYDPVQVIAESRAAEMPLIDLRAWSNTAQDAEAHRLLSETTRRPFDLSRDLMLRALLLRLADQEHVLLLVTHHIASDGLSSNILWRELATLYEAFIANQPSPLEQLPIQYADYAIWQRQWLQGEILDRQLAYWKKQLAGAPPLLELSTDHPRPAVQTDRGARQSVVLPKELTQSLKAFGRKEGVTLFMTLLAAFQTLLYRYTAQDDIVVGSPIAGRTRNEVEGLIGFFVNTLVLRTDFSGNPSFRELLARVREVALGAYAHQDLPFEKLVEELHPERNRSNSPLFQVMFVLQNDPRDTLTLTGLTVSPFDIHSGTAKFDLLLSMREENEELKGAVEYNADLFEASTIGRMIAHFRNLLNAIVTNPNRRLSEIPLLTDAERHQLLVEWNDTKRDYPNDQVVHQLFEKQVEKTPHAVAVVFDGQQLTYSEINDRANQLAHYLRSRGVSEETLVAICLDRSIEMVVGLLGILKTGGAYVPIDPEYPKDRIEFILRDTQAPVFLTQERLSRLLPDYPGQRVCIDEDRGRIGRESEKNLPINVNINNLAYVIYTSGSTGKPKGVMIQHGSVVNFLTSMAREPGMTNRDTLLALTTLSFDIAGLEIFLPLSVGGRVAMVSREVAVDGFRLAKQLSACGATMMQATPATWRMLLASGWQGSKRLNILCGGEALTDEMANQLVERSAVMWNMYGPTETTIWSAVRRIPADGGIISLGRPIANTQIYVLDQYLEPAPIGVSGELYIGGCGLARGYVNLPELTAEKFVANPFSSESSSRLYKTGDVARYLSDGNIEFLGRLDHQVKIRGFRIEIGEVEAVLGQHPSVREAAVLVREKNEESDSRLEDSNGEAIDPISKIANLQSDRHLVAYVVSKQEAVPTTLELRHFLKQKLPDYMVPSTFVILDTLPLTPSGKLDRKALPAPDGTTHGSGDLFIAPRDDIEYQLSRIWESVLGTQPIGINDNFFDLGGHSLLAIKLFAQTEKLTGRKLPISVLFRAPTIEQLAKIYHLEMSAVRFSSLVQIQPGDSKPPLFLIGGADGGVFDFARLVRHMGTDQPLYGLQSPGYDGEQDPLTQLASIASDSMDKIRKVQPEGPYLLVGHCTGGSLVFEISQQLLAQGQRVALLVLVDAPCPVEVTFFRHCARRFRLEFNKRIVNRYGHHVHTLKRLDYREWPAYFLEKLNVARTLIVERISVGNTRTASDTMYSLRTKVTQANLKAMRSYKPTPYPDRITLFLARDSPVRSPSDRRLGWSKHAVGRVDVHTIPGNHNSMFWEPDVQILAKELKTCIDKALSSNEYSHA